MRVSCGNYLPLDLLPSNFLCIAFVWVSGRNKVGPISSVMSCRATSVEAGKGGLGSERGGRMIS